MNSNLEQFASDNYAGICPEAMNYMIQANQGSAPAYGNDEWTQKATDYFRELFEIDCEVFFTFNGTAANSLSLAALCQSYHSVICHETAHIETDECGAPEFASNGSKLLLAKGENGKLTPQEIESVITKRVDIHYPKPKVISITQATELGTLYSIEELLDIKKVAQKYQLKIHMDGARFANAVAAMNKSPAEMSWKSGVDVLCFCGTKNGMALGEAIIFFNRALAEDFDYRCKQAGQLASKMRFISAPWLGLLETGAWLKNAQHANQCAAYLENELLKIEGVEIMFPREVNAVFVKLPEQVINGLKANNWLFYTFIGVGGVRFMCSWNTTKSRIDELVGDIKTGLG
ncbi:low specificity L-threonine aldolase [Anabaena sp. FACHB-709]|uniref:L-threonine aldolase n=1 Tax=Anabaena cylindrica FACHB-318 TaxID=2692880 RepID=A0ABR7ZDV0_ANACY|nr:MULTISPECIES: low specificity L-threonine aldolase [Nostocaceae]HBW33433.1 low specificity L-threonine aldolase [Nostoc sp. UBA8866]MBD2170498.1 low specificity L-threonine aldolase [Anabaena cylindrica FACHB-318]MBD2262026.1 low specificity L-threonine aldolase [Anabaena sp. FACHB-709]MBD2271830.1 low specificity L-threonine aldolase [Nostoc sp. PCC 7120 = FACHB-418]MBD2282118.1 low specificity L-threonine aldolase [Anabaena cylindrica FACHB-170]